MVLRESSRVCINAGHDLTPGLTFFSSGTCVWGIRGRLQGRILSECDKINVFNEGRAHGSIEPPALRSPAGTREASGIEISEDVKMVSFWLFAVALLSFALTGWLRRYAIAKALMDLPNSRSSHTTPTPRGGGVAIVCSFLVGMGWLYGSNLVDGATFAAVLGSGLLIAIVGFMDDRGHIPARWRLLGHFCAAAWAIYSLGGFPPVILAGVEVSLGWVGSAFAIIYLMWLLNLYNFMDGIDGIATVEAMCACFGMCALYWISGHAQLMWAPLFLGGAATGFLIWNFPPAKIFMGDAGSGFLGIILGILSLQAAHVDSRLLWAWLILLGVFIVDATYTLFRRLIRGDKVYEAHRSHAYQFASRLHGGHFPVTMAVLVVNLFWLLPLAWLVACQRLDGVLATCIAYVPLTVMAIRYHAGELEVVQPKTHD